MLRTSAALTLLCASVVFAPKAAALDIYGMDLKVGIRGGPNLALMLEPEGGDLYPNIPYTNYMGSGWTLGGAINYRLFDIIALEVGWLYSRESVTGSHELRDVRDCRFTNGCKRQVVGQRFSLSAHHVPILIQASLPLGVAKPYISLGVDVVFNRSNRELRPRRDSPLPQDLDPNDPGDQPVLAEWETSPRGQNVLRAELNDTPDMYAGLVAGLGVNVALSSIEIPVEFRFHLYPKSGGLLPQRGEFGDPCVSGNCPYDPASAPPRYNDMWNMQLFVLFGLDYVIF